MDLSLKDRLVLSRLYDLNHDETGKYPAQGFTGLKLISEKTGRIHAMTRKNPFELTKYLNPNQECYYTVNSLNTHQSNFNADNVVGYNGLFCDLDVTGHGTSLRGKKILDMAYINIVKALYPKIKLPTYTVMTGHGFDFVWLFDHQVTDNTKDHVIGQKWQALENWLLDTLHSIDDIKPFVDMKVHDPARVIRFMGTNNNKYLRDGSTDKGPIKTKVMAIMDSSFNFWKLYHKHVQAKHDVKKWTKKQAVHGYHSPVKHYTYRQINMKRRVGSVIKLCSLRDNKVTGYRNTILHIIASGLLYANASLKNKSVDEQDLCKDNIIKLIYHLNDTFTESLPKSEVKVIADKVEKSKFNISSKSHDFAKYAYCTASTWKGRHCGIAYVLNLTAYEMSKLKYLRVPSYEHKIKVQRAKNHYYATRQAHKFAAKAEKHNQALKTVILMHRLWKRYKHGVSLRKLADKYGGQLAKINHKSKPYTYSSIRRIMKRYYYLAKNYSNELDRLFFTKYYVMSINTNNVMMLIRHSRLHNMYAKYPTEAGYTHHISIFGLHGRRYQRLCQFTIPQIEMFMAEKIHSGQSNILDHILLVPSDKIGSWFEKNSYIGNANQYSQSYLYKQGHKTFSNLLIPQLRARASSHQSLDEMVD